MVPPALATGSGVFSQAPQPFSAMWLGSGEGDRVFSEVLAKHLANFTPPASSP